VIVGVAGQSFRLMSRIVSFVSSGEETVGKIRPDFYAKIKRKLLNFFGYYAARLSTPAPRSRSASCLRA
jgi:hypothetical protein